MSRYADIADRFAENLRSAGGRKNNPHQQFDSSGAFARAVGSEKSNTSPACTCMVRPWSEVFSSGAETRAGIAC
jgi:hypothetical protein